MLRELYSLDTLDTRFAASKKPVESRPSKWNTWEYYVYYLVFLVAVPTMFWSPYNVSKQTDPQYHTFSHLLSPGWIPGRLVDNSDAQYASFRNNIPYMAAVVIIHPLVRKIYNHFSTSDRLQQRVRFDVAFACIFLVVLHGVSSLKVFAILSINYSITKLPKSFVPSATWIFNIGTLFANELAQGYSFSIVGLGHLDEYGGLIRRWEILFNLTVLRLISFNLDYYWSLGRGNIVEKKQLDPANLSERDRLAIPASTFSFQHYLAYTLYSPLYLTGPILTYNDFVSQLRYPSASITTRRTVLYGIRFLLTLLTMELVLHYIYAVAISKSHPDWSKYTPMQLSMLGFFNLHIIWLKLLIPWRFFRFWSLLDGIDPPENMVRCMSDNFSALAFWRGWHRSFNRWIVRYIFVPLGGTGRGTSPLRSLANLLAVFTFVALWHDISLRLLTWSWLIVLFLLPEVICSKLLFPASRYKNAPETYRMLSGIGAVGNILMMMAANLVGFALGLDGLVGLVKGIISGWEGWAFLGMACATLFVGAQVMFELREEEVRRGIVMKC